MTTELPPGAVFIVREAGEYMAWDVSADGAHYGILIRPLQPGETVHLAVWTGERRDHLDVRKSYVLQPGDVAWVDTGEPKLDFTRPPDPVWGYHELAETVFKNEFRGGPRWVREAV